MAKWVLSLPYNAEYGKPEEDEGGELPVTIFGKPPSMAAEPGLISSMFGSAKPEPVDVTKMTLGYGILHELHR